MNILYCYSFILDDEPPSLGSCPSNVRTFISAGSSTVTVTYTPSVPTASDNSGAPSVVCTPSSGNMFGVGNWDVTCTATDDYGNSDSCSFRVTVIGKNTIDLSHAAAVFVRFPVYASNMRGSTLNA